MDKWMFFGRRVIYYPAIHIVCDTDKYKYNIIPTQDQAWYTQPILYTHIQSKEVQ